MTDTKATTATEAAPEKLDTAITKACPTCAEQVQSAAVRCRYCGHKFKQATTTHRTPTLARRIILASGVLVACALTGVATYVVADPAGARADGKKAGIAVGSRQAGAERDQINAASLEFRDGLHKDEVASLRTQLRSARNASVARYRDGGKAALGEFGAPWQAGHAYIVTTKTEPDLGVTIATRGDIEPGTLYLRCGASPTDLCTRPDPAY